MEKYLAFVSVHTWTMVFTWINLIILFLLLKKFLFKPVNKVLDDRAAEIENTYRAAEESRREADDARDRCNAQLLKATGEADEIVKKASKTAHDRSDAIVASARDEARQIIEKSQEQAERDRQNALADARREVAGLAVDIAERIIGESVDGSIDEKIISKAIERIE